MLSLKPSIYDLDWSALKTKILQWGEAEYRTEQIWRGIYKQYYNSPDQFTNLSAKLRERLAEEFCFTNLHGSLTFSRLQPETSQFSSDGETQKILFRISDPASQRLNLIETVLMRYERRNTLCVSSQVGCAMGCVFCATGQMGFTRHLSSGEIIEQIIYFARQLDGEKQSVTNIVIMGMGEPFHNYPATLDAISRLNDPRGMDLGERRFTISTVGLVPMIYKFAEEKRQINLAISLHAAEDDLRQSMLPINKKYPIASLMTACKEYIAKTRRRLTFEWALIDGVNDSPAEALRLANLLKTLRTPEGALLVHVNAIPLNPTHQYNGKATSRQRAAEFKATLETNGIPCTVRVRRGIDIQAGCGQLAGTKHHPERDTANESK